MDSKQRIYECAKILFFEEGFNNTTKRKVSELSGINQSMINYYFKELGNVAAVVFAENYQILTKRIAPYVDYEKEPFLIDVVFEILSHRISEMNPSMARFVTDASREMMFGCDAYNYAAREHNMVLLGLTPADNSGKLSAEVIERYNLFTSLKMGIKSYYFSKYSQGDFNKEKFDRYLIFLIKVQMFALGRVFTDEQTAEIISKATDITERLLEDNPDLKKPSIYLYHKSILHEEPVMDLLNNAKFE